TPDSMSSWGLVASAGAAMAVATVPAATAAVTTTRVSMPPRTRAIAPPVGWRRDVGLRLGPQPGRAARECKASDAAVPSVRPSGRPHVAIGLRFYWTVGTGRHRLRCGVRHSGHVP